ncbi:hypothetical protein KUCAC02_002175 [Chaenocephalus aceratus]|uniref:Uncharacterized protein n=1 Tax=Chaenocephalus aceratus TaxID=36190 RepID=A0ACB9XUX9_CHAAC|nr:hypothetical protein KUCAC02_002175 [Chaenocephalus aceratus]
MISLAPPTGYWQKLDSLLRCYIWNAAKKRPFEEVSDEDEGLSGGGAAGGEDGAKKSARQSGRGAEWSSGGGKKCRSPGVVEDISEASERAQQRGELGTEISVW